MSARTVLFAAAAVLPLAAAAGAPEVKKPPAPPSQAEQLVRNCNAHKFETVVQEMVDGQPHQSKVTLCGKEGQSDADWVGTLKDAIDKVNANAQMAAPMRDQIIAALNAEIDRLRNPLSLVPRRAPGKTSLVDSLPPLAGLPSSKPAENIPLPPPRQTAPTAPAEEYAALPPLPTAPPPPVRVLAGAGGSLAALPRPRMSFVCYDAGQAEGPCTGFTRETVLTVRAGEDLPAGTSLRFVRDGEPRADVALAQLKKGGSMQLNVPADVCRHVVGGRLELRIVRSGQEVGSEGPFNLNC
jgi:hypothetical protein